MGIWQEALKDVADNGLEQHLDIMSERRCVCCYGETWEGLEIFSTNDKKRGISLNK